MLWLGFDALAEAREWRVSQGSSLQQAISFAHPGDTLRVAKGVYSGPLAIPISDLTLLGTGMPVLDGGGMGSVVLILGSRVVLRGFRITHSGSSPNGDDAGIKLLNADACTISGNVLEHVYHGVYLQKARDNKLISNALTGDAPIGAYEGWGDGVHAWNSPGNLMAHNVLSRFRDGFYLEFARDTRLEHNEAFDNQRYGLHFMFMDDSRFRFNRFRHNQAGSVLMYSKRIKVERNDFLDNRGPVGDGLLFKENNDSLVSSNRILNNTVGMFLDGANRNRFEDNLIAGNGWGMLLYSSSVGNVFKGNTFYANDYEVAVDMPASRNTLDGNYWSGYQGYDLKGTGRGDIPYSPVSMFSFLAMQFPDLYAFALSPAVKALAFAQRLFPALAPSALSDPHPLMKPRRAIYGPG